MMKKTILLYSLALAILLGLLKAVEYRFLLRDLSMELYVGIVALFFSALGIWAGLQLTRRFNPAGSTNMADPQHPVLLEPTQLLEKYNLSKREYEVLTLIAQGYSNQYNPNSYAQHISTSSNPILITQFLTNPRNSKQQRRNYTSYHNT